MEFDRGAASSRRPDALAIATLVAANLVPLVGVLFFDWQVLNIALLYWVENIVVGIYAVLRMLKVGGATALPLAIFFCVHFGGFCAGHLLFIVVLLGGAFDGTATAASPPAASGALAWLLGIAAMFVSHGVSYVRNFLGKREYERSSINAEMGKPYPRMIVLHVAIVLGAFAVASLGSPIGFLLLLVLLKLGLDLAVHYVGHRMRLAATNPDAATATTPESPGTPPPPARWPSRGTTRLP